MQDNTKNNTDIIKKLAGQIEYYLSDKNLQHDEFFYKLISKHNNNNYIDINYFLNCNNVKKLTTNKQDVIDAVLQSDKLRINNDNTGIKRKDSNIPNFLGRKRNNEINDINTVSIKDKNVNTCNFENDNTDLNSKYLKEEPIIVSLSSNKDEPVKWKNLHNKLKEILPSYEVIYTRFGFQKGHSAIFKKDDIDYTDINLTDFKDKKDFTLDNIDFSLILADNKEIIEFWKNHGSHYELCINNKLNDDNKIISNKKYKKKQDKNILKKPVTLGDEMYIIFNYINI